MKIPNNLYYPILIIFTFIFALSIYAEGNASQFRHPLNIQAIGLYNKVRIKGQAEDRRLEDEYTRNQNLNLEGEFQFHQNFSVSLDTGFTDHRQSGSGSYKGRDRIGVGFKSSWESDNLMVSGGLLGYGKNPSQPKLENQNPDFFILRPYFGLGYKIGDFQIQGELHLQSETNSAFKEKYNEEFRRHYQAGLSLSYGVLDFLNLFLEAETRIPYNQEIDGESRYASIYPGISFADKDWGTLAISGGIPVIDDRIYDRSIRLQYFYFWD